MSRPTYAPKQKYTGNGALAVYTFNFLIEEDTQLEIVELDENNVETQRVRGDDVTYLTGLVFDPINGGGTVTLAANLVNNYTLILLEANDDPTQPFEFKNKGTFTIRRFESALDWVTGAIQRLAYRGRQALRIHDADDQEVFNGMLPPDVAGNPAASIIINETGDGLDFGPTAGDLQATIDAAAAALVSETNAATSETNAAISAAAALVSELAAAVSAAAALQSAIDAAASVAASELLIVFGTQSVASGAAITHSADMRQYRRVQSATAGAITILGTPFGNNPALFLDGMEIIIVGINSTKTIQISKTDVQYGVLTNGDIILGKGQNISLFYDATLERWVSRNVF